MKFKVGDIFFYKYRYSHSWFFGKVTSIKVEPVYTLYYDVVKIMQGDQEDDVKFQFFHAGSLMYRYSKIINDMDESTILAMVL